MEWDYFYDRYWEWSNSTIKNNIYKLCNVGKGAEVVDVCLDINDEKTKIQLIRKVMKLGVIFTHNDFMNLEDEFSDDFYEEIAEYAGFYAKIPYFNEHDFTWDDFYNECADLPIDMILRCIPRITKFGNSDEVVYAIECIDDSKATDDLYERAISCGVKFTEEQLEEMGRSDKLFLVDDINSIINIPDKEIKKLHKNVKKLSKNINKQMNKNKKRSSFWSSLFAIGSIVSEESNKKHKNNRRCDGNCAKCPDHYGYRHGRWYYGHGHNYGCEYGGNKGGGMED